MVRRANLDRPSARLFVRPATRLFVRQYVRPPERIANAHNTKFGHTKCSRGNNNNYVKNKDRSDVNINFTEYPEKLASL